MNARPADTRFSPSRPSARDALSNFPPVSGKVIDVEAEEREPWRRWGSRHLQGGLGRQSIFMIAFWGVIILYLVFNLIIVFELIVS